jgi:hypothetical protein
MPGLRSVGRRVARARRRQVFGGGSKPRRDKPVPDHPDDWSYAMNLFKTIRNGAHAGVPDGEATDASSADTNLTDRYERLNEREAVAELAQLNQIELTAIETFERAHRDRDAVLNKLRYLRQVEPLPGYDALEPGAIGEALSGADVKTVKAVREYERKFQNRGAALDEISRALLGFAEQSEAAPVEAPARARDHEQPLVVGNGLPIKVKPESGVDL